MSKVVAPIKERGFLLYISYLRVIATFSVIFLHVCAIYISEPLYSFKWNTAVLLDSLVRFCVPVFLMISGATILNQNEPVPVFLKKRFTRIVLPFLFWSLVYIFLRHKSMIDLQFYKVIIREFIVVPSFHMWYIYLILGLYLFIPILRPWAIASSQKEKLYFLIIWFGICCIDFAHLKPFLPQIELMYFSKYIGYLVLGKFANDLEIDNIPYKKITGAALYILGVAGTFAGTYYISGKAGSFRENFFDYLSPTVIIASTGIFLFFRSLRLRRIKLLENIDKNSYGIYLIHILALTFVAKLIIYFSLDSPYIFVAYILFASVFTFIISWGVISLLAEIKPIRKFIT